jgi:hypothetical protein
VLEICGLESFRAALDATCETAFCMGSPSRRSSPEPVVRANSQAEALRLSWSERRPRSWHASWL